MEAKLDVIGIQSIRSSQELLSLVVSKVKRFSETFPTVSKGPEGTLEQQNPGPGTSWFKS